VQASLSLSLLPFEFESPRTVPLLYTPSLMGSVLL
jgi:hypothetical protein